MKYKAQNLLYLEWCISIGKVIDDSQGLLKPRASNASVCYQLAHCLDNLRYKDECGVRTRDSQNILKWYICTLFCYADLQMGADYRLSLGKLKVFSHEKIEQGSCLRLGGAGTMVAALEDLIAQTATQVCLTLEECTGELQKDKAKMSAHVRKKRWDSSLRCWMCTRCSLDLLHKEPERSEDMP